MVQGVGYEVVIAPRVLSTLVKGKEVSLFTYHHVKEDSQDLFGFMEHDELVLFKKLLTVSGVGPKTALTVLSGMTPSDFTDALLRNDSGALTKVSGVGKKTAERIVLELKEKVGVGLSSTSGIVSVDMQVIEALENLGYTPADARTALKMCEGDYDSADKKLKAVLQNLGQRQ